MGLSYKGLIDVNITKEEIMKLTSNDVNQLLLKPKPRKFNALIFSLLSILSMLVLIFPILSLVILWFVFL